MARALPPDPPDPDIVRPKTLARTARSGKAPGHDRQGRSAAWTVIRAVKMAHGEQVRMWECVLLTSGAARSSRPVRCDGWAALDSNRTTEMTAVNTTSGIQADE